MAIKLEELKGVISQDNRDYLKKTEEAKEANKGLVSQLVSGSIRASKSIVELSQNAARLGDNLGKSARQTGFTVAEFQKLNTVSERIGLSVGTMSAAINDQNRALDRGLKVQGFYTRALKELGLKQEDLEKKTPVERFLAQAAALAKVRSETKRNVLANDLFGSSSASLNNILKAQPKIFKGAEDAIKRRVRTTAQATSEGEKFMNNLNEIQNNLQKRSIKGRIGEKAVPILNEVLEIGVRRLSQQNVNRPGGGPGGIRNLLEWSPQDSANLEEIKNKLAELF